MENKRNIIGAAVLIFLGLILAIGYPKESVKNEVTVKTKTGNKTVLNLTKEGNAKNFVKVKKHKVTSSEKVTPPHLTKQTVVEQHITKKLPTKRIVNKQPVKVKKIIRKQIKKKVKLAPPPPPAEDDDEGC